MCNMKRPLRPPHKRSASPLLSSTGVRCCIFFLSTSSSFSFFFKFSNDNFQHSKNFNPYGLAFFQEKNHFPSPNRIINWNWDISSYRMLPLQWIFQAICWLKAFFFFYPPPGIGRVAQSDYAHVIRCGNDLFTPIVRSAHVDRLF